MSHLVRKDTGIIRDQLLMPRLQLRIRLYQSTSDLSHNPRGQCRATMRDSNKHNTSNRRLGSETEVLRQPVAGGLVCRNPGQRTIGNSSPHPVMAEGDLGFSDEATHAVSDQNDMIQGRIGHFFFQFCQCDIQVFPQPRS